MPPKSGNPKKAPKAAATGAGAIPTSSTPAQASNPVEEKPFVDDGSRQLAALGYGLLVLLAAPTLRLAYGRPDGGDGVLQFSAIECACIGLIEVAPFLTPLTQVLMFPSIWMRKASFMLRYCMDKDPYKCRPELLTDFNSIFADSDVTPLLPILKRSFAPVYLNLLLVGGAVMTFTALVGIVSKPVKAGVLGLVLMGLAAYMTPMANFLPTLLMQGFLGGYVLMYNQAALEKDKAKREAKARERAMAMLERRKAKEAAVAGGKTGSGQSPYKI